MGTLRFTPPGVGAMNSPRYAPAGLLAEHGAARVAIDGGPGAEPAGPATAWLVTDEHAELIAGLRHAAATRGLVPTSEAVLSFASRLQLLPSRIERE